ncbi:monosaccharide ABC transporter ATP-binding protein (CUT2 family) [Paenibacillus prosopidis]|uniref:Monosaccharide ABC transporter ATP-binding protein (CUT2 family) n=2 Tax=Paenibacillus prosopidis TaxID=630520 RepID=A0A368W5I9_9BACL|nr:monosaccharide ABC transporter ATP-binding protein (CUT2 family) [Paenibacillus prosopidis]
MTDSKASRLDMKRISIAFPGVKALTEVDFYTVAGRAHALIGANGAGKSTLMKVLAGVYDHYTGEICIDGKEVHIRNPKEAKDNGIQVVYQEVDTALIPNLSVGENIMLDQTVHDMNGRHLIHWKQLHQSAQAVLDKMNVKVSTRKLVQDLTLAEKQMVLIARAVSKQCRFLVLDEPTAPLSHSETEQLFRLIRKLKTDGVGIIFISHRLPELYKICDDITIMRDGQLVVREELAKIDQHKVVEYMLGAKMDGQFPQTETTIGGKCFEAKGIRDKGKVNNVDLYIRKGEIVGLAGLVGAGKTELCRALFGASETSSGDIYLEGRKLRINTPYEAVQNGLALVPEERRREGVFVEESVSVNLTAAILSRFTRLGPWLSTAKEKNASAEIIRNLGIKTPNGQAIVKNLSGGNQQKVAIGKWLLVDADVYIFDEPTKGVDVGAKRDIYDLVAELAGRGKCILYASSEMSEIIGITDRIYVMYDGSIIKELETRNTDEEEILLYSTGGLLT